MSKGINQVFLIGLVGKDAELVDAGSCKVLKFSIATSRKYKSGSDFKEDTTWHNIVSWNGEKVARYIKKGVRICVTGRISNRSYTDKDGSKRYVSEVVAEDILLLESGQHSYGSVSQADGFGGDDDIPF